MAVRSGLSFIITAFFYLYSCSNPTKTTLQDIIKKYERFVLEMKADSISELFTSNAEVGHADQPPVKGRDSIYAFYLHNWLICKMKTRSLYDSPIKKIKKNFV